MIRFASSGAWMQGWNRVAMSLALVVGGIGSAACGPMTPEGGMGDIAIFEARGGCSVQTSMQTQGGTTFTIFQPTAGQGCAAPFPVVGWGNGSFTNTNSYTAFLTTVASHGFTVVSANVANANGALGGGGQTTVDDSIRLGLARPNTGGTACAMGYSQGGSAAVRGALLVNQTVCTVGIAAERVLTGPANAQGLTRTLFLGGGADTVAPVGNNSQTLFNQAGQPKVLAVLAGVDHFEPLGDGGRYRGLAIAALVLNLRTSDPNFAAASRLYNNNGLAADPRVAMFTRQGTF